MMTNSKWNPYILHTCDPETDEIISTQLLEEPVECWSRYGCYLCVEDAKRAATFLFGVTNWDIRWSDHGWFYITPRQGGEPMTEVWCLKEWRGNLEGDILMETMRRHRYEVDDLHEAMQKKDEYTEWRIVRCEIKEVHDD
jgi:hypothetical protein